MPSRAAFSCVASDAAVAAAAEHLTALAFCGSREGAARRATPARAGGADGFGKKARLARAARRADGAAAEARRVAAVAAARRSAMAGWGD